MLDIDDTIVAIASPTSPAARGIVRLSGPEVVAILAAMGVHPNTAASRAERFDVGVDVGPPLGQLPVSVMLWPTTRSYTGQPSAELHTIGSLPLLTALTDTALAAGARAARPGEFTMRAFLAGRLDLTQAEAVLGVIEAQGRGSLDHALRQLAGNLSRPLEQMRATILDLLADVEAGLDFVDEDIEFITDEVLTQRLAEIAQQLQQTLSMMQIRGGGSARTVIALRGQPNAGKSCLINRLAGQQVAIVTDVAGTTRDTVSVDTEIAGRPVRLVDTAGIESGDSEVSRHSQLQAQRACDEADIRLWCVDSSRDDFAATGGQLWQQAVASRRASVLDLAIATKTDLRRSAAQRTMPLQHALTDQPPPWIHCSAVSGAGIDRVRQAISAALASRDAEEVGSVVGTAARCGQSLRHAHQAITTAIELTCRQQGHEFVSAELRTAAGCVGEVTGAVYTDDILDRVFGRFCIGK